VLRSSTSVFSWVLLGALAAAPLVLSEAWLVPRYSGRAIEIGALANELAVGGEKRILLLGDSTARRLHFVAPGFEPGAPRPPDEWLNLALGGSSMIDWVLQCERAVRDRPGLKRVVVLASSAEYVSTIGEVYAPYIAYLSSPRDAVELWRSGAVSAGDAARLVARQLFHTYSDRNDLLFAFFSRDPDLGPWADRMSFREGAPRPDLAAASRMAARAAEWSARLAACGSRVGARTVLVLAPLHSARRATALHATERAAFEAACGTDGFTCFDFETAFPDADFDADLVHLKPGLEPRMLEKLSLAIRR
jgi:hypothetical protein